MCIANIIEKSPPALNCIFLLTVKIKIRQMLWNIMWASWTAQCQVFVFSLSFWVPSNGNKPAFRHNMLKQWDETWKMWLDKMKFKKNLHAKYVSYDRFWENPLQSIGSPNKHRYQTVLEIRYTVQHCQVRWVLSAIVQHQVALDWRIKHIKLTDYCLNGCWGFFWSQRRAIIIITRQY